MRAGGGKTIEGLHLYRFLDQDVVPLNRLIFNSRKLCLLHNITSFTLQIILLIIHALLHITILDFEDRCHSVGCMSPPISCLLGHYSLVNNDPWTIFTSDQFPLFVNVVHPRTVFTSDQCPPKRINAVPSGLVTQVIMNAECILCNEACKQRCK